LTKVPRPLYPVLDNSKLAVDGIRIFTCRFRLPAFLVTADRPPMPQTFHALYLQTTNRHQAEALTALRRLHERTFPTLEPRILIVDNALTAPAVVELAADTMLVAGDNTFREFSGWDHGWNWLGRHHPPAHDDVVCLCNETFMADREAADFYSLDPTVTQEHIGRGSLIGHVDGLPQDMCLFGTSMRHWMRSNLVLMSARVLRELSPLTLPLADAELFVDDPAVFFRNRVDLDGRYRELIRGFLQGRPNAGLWRWHSAQPFTAVNLTAFRLKARAILSEHSLSARAVRNGHALVDLSQPRLLSKDLRNRLGYVLYVTGAWQLVPRFRRRFAG